MQKFIQMKSSLTASEYEAAEALKGIKRKSIFNEVIYDGVHHGDPDQARFAFQLIREQMPTTGYGRMCRILGSRQAVDKVMSLYKNNV